MIETIIRYGLEAIGFCVLFILFLRRIVPLAVTLLGFQRTPEELKEIMEHKRGILIVTGFLGLLISVFISFAIIYYIDKLVR